MEVRLYKQQEAHQMVGPGKMLYRKAWKYDSFEVASATEQPQQTFQWCVENCPRFWAMWILRNTLPAIIFILSGAALRLSQQNCLRKMRSTSTRWFLRRFAYKKMNLTMSKLSCLNDRASPIGTILAITASIPVYFFWPTGSSCDVISASLWGWLSPIQF